MPAGQPASDLMSGNRLPKVFDPSIVHQLETAPDLQKCKVRGFSISGVHYFCATWGHGYQRRRLYREPFLGGNTSESAAETDALILPAAGTAQRAGHLQRVPSLLAQGRSPAATLARPHVHPTDPGSRSGWTEPEGMVDRRADGSRTHDALRVGRAAGMPMRRRNCRGLP